jgi:hypothetical protein
LRTVHIGKVSLLAIMSTEKLPLKVSNILVLYIKDVACLLVFSPKQALLIPTLLAKETFLLVKLS